MGAKNQVRNNITFLKLRAKTSDTDPTPFFGKSEKKGDTWEVVEKFDSVDGKLVDIGYSSYEFEKEQKWKCVMKLVDDDGSVTQVESNFNGLLYSILNSLRGVSPELIELNVWLGKAKVENGREGKRYASVGVKNNGNKIGWHVPYDQLPKPEMIPAGKKIVADDTNVIDYWKGVIDDIKPTLTAEVKIVHEVAPQVHQEEPSQLSNDDLPF